MRVRCRACGSRSSEHPLEWVLINGNPVHYTEDCLRRRLGQKREPAVGQGVRMEIHPAMDGGEGVPMGRVHAAYEAGYQDGSGRR